MYKKITVIPGAQLVGKGGRPPLPFFENKEKCPDFGKKHPDCGHPWVKSAIQNVVLKVSKRKNSKIFSSGAFFLGFLIKCLSNCPNFTKPSLPWKISGCAPEYDALQKKKTKKKQNKKNIPPSCQSTSL